MNHIMLGAIIAVSMVIALFFLRFWRSSGDRFFLFFALSFLIDGLDRLWLATATPSTEDSPSYYLVRLCAYGLILFAIFDKNRPRDKDR